MTIYSRHPLRPHARRSSRATSLLACMSLVVASCAQASPQAVERAREPLVGATSPSDDTHFVALDVETESFRNEQTLVATYDRASGRSVDAPSAPVAPARAVLLPPEIHLQCAGTATCDAGILVRVAISSPESGTIICRYRALADRNRLLLSRCDDSRTVAAARPMRALVMRVAAPNSVSHDVSASGAFVYLSALSHLCSGTLVADNAVVTAAHCVARRDSADDPSSFAIVDPATVTVRVTRDIRRPPQGRYGVRAVYVAPQMRFPLAENMENDIAVLQLAERVTTAVPIALASPPHRSFAAGDVVRVTAFGAEFDGVSGRRRFMEIVALRSEGGVAVFEPFSRGAAWFSGDSGGGIVRTVESGACPGAQTLDAVVSSHAHRSDDGSFTMQFGVEIGPHYEFLAETVAGFPAVD